MGTVAQQGAGNNTPVNLFKFIDDLSGGNSDPLVYGYTAAFGNWVRRLAGTPKFIESISTVFPMPVLVKETNKVRHYVQAKAKTGTKLVGVSLRVNAAINRAFNVFIDGGNLVIYRWDGGSTYSEVKNVSGVSIPNGFVLKASIDENGLITVYVDGAPFTTYAAGATFAGNTHAGLMHFTNFATEGPIEIGEF